MKKKVTLFVIIILSSLFVVPSPLYAAGSIELTSTMVGDTTTITATPNANDCSNAITNFAIAKVNVSEHDSSKDIREWSDDSSSDDYPVDLSKAKIQVSINGKNIDGKVQKTAQDFVIWIPVKQNSTDQYPQFLKEDKVIIKIVDATIAKPGKATFSTTVQLHPTLDSCFGFGMPTTSIENGVTKNIYKPEYTFEFKEGINAAVPTISSVPAISTVPSAKSSNEKNNTEVASQSSSLLHLLSKNILWFMH